MPNLEEMTLDDLSELADRLANLGRAGAVLRDMGFAPVFDLSPGEDPHISLQGWQMPHAWSLDEHEAGAEAGASPRNDAPYAWATEEGLVPLGPVAAGKGLGKAISDVIRHKFDAPDEIATPHHPGAKPIAMAGSWNDPSPPAPGDSAAAIAGAAGTDPADDAPAAVNEATAAGVAPEISEPEPPAAPPPPVAGAAETAPEQEPAPANVPGATPTAGGTDPASGGGVAAAPAAPQPAAMPAPQPAPWTADEDTSLINLVVGGLRDGLTRAEAMRRAADFLGRPIEGTKYRLYTKLKDRLAQAEAAAPIAASPAPEPAPDRAPDPAPTAGASTLPAFLATRDMVTKGQRWSTAEDRDLMQMIVDGLDQNSIALDLGIAADKVKARFDYLTGLKKLQGPDASKMVRTWTAREVAAELQARATAAE